MLCPRPSLDVYSGDDRAEVIAALQAGCPSDEGPARLAVTRLGAGLPQTGRLPTGREEFVADVRRWLTEGGSRPAGVAYRDAPLAGETAFVFTNAAAAYPGMGKELGQSFRPTAEAITATTPSLPFDGGFGRHLAPPDPVDQVAATMLLSSFHTALTRDLLRLRPAASIGFCTGELAGLNAMGVWPDIEGLYQDAMASGLFHEELSGEFRALRRVWQRAGLPGERWMSYWVNAPTEEVRALVGPLSSVHLMSVYAPSLCVIGGEANACRELVERAFPDRSALPTGFHTAAHVPEAAEVRDRLHQLFLRPTTTVPGIRFYNGAGPSFHTPDQLRVADAVTAQMVGHIDLCGAVRSAWEDGVRIFVEHGPRAVSTTAVRAALGEREHLAVALDAPGRRALPQFCRTLSELAAAGIRLDTGRLFAALSPATVTIPAQVSAPAGRVVVR